MSKRILELLRATSLLNSDNSVADLKTIPASQLQQTLKYYHQKRVESADKEISALADARLRNATTLSSVSAGNAVLSLCPKFLVHESLVVGDPLFELAMPTNEHTRVEKQALGMGSDEGLNLGRLSNKLSYFSELAPFIEAGFLHVVPLELLHEAPEHLPLNFPKNLYREQVPPGAVDFVKRTAIVRPMERTAEGLIIRDEPNSHRKRHICITFEGDEAATGCSFYHFREFEYHGETEDGNLRVSYKPWSDEPLDQAQYDIWVEQATNQTIGARLDSIAKEMRLADIIGAPYMTESSFEAELLSLSGMGVSGERIHAVGFLEANKDLIEVSDPSLIFRLRTDNEALFERFRLSVAAVAEELKGLSEGDFERKAKQIFDSEIQPQIAEVNATIGRLEGAAAKGLLQTGAALVLGVLTGGSLPVAAWLALGAAGVGAEALPAIGDYLRTRKQPQFLWHKLSK